MKPADDSGYGVLRAAAVAAIALLALLYSLTPLADRADAAILDVEWSLLSRLDSRPAPDDIMIVGVDEASYREILEPPGMWHAQIGEVLVRVASAQPRAIGLDIALPERSFEPVRAGLDRALLVGLAAARRAAPIVAGLSIDARSRAARPVFPPLLAVLGEDGLGISLLARDGD